MLRESLSIVGVDGRYIHDGCTYLEYSMNYEL